MHISGRTNTILLVLILAVGVAIVAMLATGVRGGPLDPSGAPASTDGVREPGTPISSLPFTISQPGRYYVTHDLTGLVGQNGITISQSDVTLDLNGFTLRGVSQTGDGVLISGAPSAITIQNGIVRGWYNGIDAQLGSYVTISGIAVIHNGGASSDGSYGVIIKGHSVLKDCMVSDGAATGALVVASTVSDCVFIHNANDGLYAGNGVFVQHTRLRRNGGVGSWYDTRFVGTNSILDSDVGNVGIDLSVTDADGVIARSSYCGLNAFGAHLDFTERLDISIGAC